MKKIGDRKLLNYRPIVAIALSLAFGVYFSITDISVSVLKLALFLVIFLLVASFETKIEKRRIIFKSLTWLLIAFIVGITIGLTQLFFFTRDVVEVVGKFRGTVESVTYGSAEKKAILKDLVLNGINVAGKAEVTLNAQTSLVVGDIVDLFGKISGSNAITHDRIYTYYISNNIKYIGDCQSVKVVGKAALNLSQIIRRNIYSTLVENIDYQNAGIIMGMIFGETSMMNKTVSEAFKVTGLGHIFAVSGLNVGYFYTICFFILSKFSVKVKSIVTVIFVTLYVYICGMTVSATRALVMIMMSILTQNLRFEIDGMTNLAFAMIVSLIINPYSLFSAGFALSFGAVLSLIILRPQIVRILPFKKQSTRENIGGLIGIQLVMLPLMSFYFSYISVFSFLINLLIIPAISFMYIANLFILILQQTVGLNLLVITNAMIELLKSFLILIQSSGIAVIEYQFSKISLALSMIVLLILSDLLLIPNKRKVVVSIPFVLLFVLTVTIA